MIDTDAPAHPSPSSLAFTLTAQAQPYPVTVHHGVAATMRDGVKLIADIYQPDTGANAKFPVLLERTPCNRAGGASSAAAIAAHGCVVIVQDTRGRFDSQGEFYPFKYESQDGYDTVEWAAKLPYGDGKVGMFGGSYGLAIDTLRRKASGLEDPKLLVTQLPVDSYRVLELPPVSALAPYFRDWITHERDDDYWRPWKISDHYATRSMGARRDVARRQDW
jgi:hypothetical protein